MSDEEKNNYPEAIAIIGMNGRFPGAENVQQFWSNLREGVESISFFTAADLEKEDLDPFLRKNPKYVGAEGIVRNIDLFDARFFDYTPREAEMMDPQHRLFLECAWELMEMGCYDSGIYPGKVGVFAGTATSSYLIRNILSQPDLYRNMGSFQITLSNDKDFVATKVSFKFNFTGPSINVHTLCSSSSVAIHLACQSLLNYECDLALAGGASIPISRNEAFFYQEGNIGDPDGHCRAFDHRAKGTVAGGGVAMILLKRMEDALEEGDHILAVIRGTGISNDGHEKISYTAPSPIGQAEAVVGAISTAGINPETITYVETHGTGTALGDPIEIEGLTRAFRTKTNKRNFCGVGSVKTNIGHLVHAGGMASLIKTVLALQHKEIPANLNFEKPNPRIDFAASPFYVVSKLTPWKRVAPDVPLRAGVSSCGIGGTNVHVILEEAPGREPSGPSRPWHLVLLSAKSGAGLEKAVKNLADFLTAHPGTNPADLAYSLQVGRRAFSHRWMFICKDVPGAAGSLSAFTQSAGSFQEAQDRYAAMLFSGSCTPGMEAKWLYREEPAFRKAFDECSAVLNRILKLDLSRNLSGANEPAAPDNPLAACVLQFSYQYSLAALWQEWGIKPRLLFGIGTGEYVAGCLAGIMSLENSLSLLIARTRLEQNTISQAEYAAGTGELSFHPPVVPFLSTRTNREITGEEAAGRDYWIRSGQQPVQVTELVKSLAQQPELVLLEVGTDEALTREIVQAGNNAQVVLPSFTLQENRERAAGLYETLGKLWLAGVKVDWNCFSRYEKRNRILLPTYPFERQRYWIDPPGAAALFPAQGQQQVNRRAEREDWFYVPAWKNKPLIPAAAAPDRNRWLIFADNYGIGDKLAGRFKSAAHDLILVGQGAGFKTGDAGRFVINPGRAEDYQALFRELKKQGKIPQNIVYMPELAPPGAEIPAPGSSLVFLLQAMEREQYTDPVKLLLVSNAVYDVTGNEQVLPGKSVLSGLAKVIPHEYSRIRCREIDLEYAAFPGPRDNVDALYRELTGNSGDLTVCLRSSRRWVQCHEPVFPDAALKTQTLLKTGGVYFITGRLDALDLCLAHYLAGQYKAHLVLLKEPGFPPREEWNAWLARKGETDGISRQIKEIQALEKAGPGVLALRGDPGDKAQVEQAFAQVKSSFGKIDGIIFPSGSQGAPVFKTIDETETAALNRHVQETAGQLMLLADLLKEEQYDFFLSNASLAAVLGGTGLSRYAVSGSYLNAFTALNARTSNAPWICINWDRYETGAQDEQQEFSIREEEAGAVLELVLACPVPGMEMIVSVSDLQARIDKWLKPGAAGRELLPGKKELELHPRPDLPTAYTAPRNATEERIAAIWRDMMGLDRIGINDNFFELGGDSLLATQIFLKIRQAFQYDIPLENLFENPTVHFIAEYVETAGWAAGNEKAANTGGNAKREEWEI